MRAIDVSLGSVDEGYREPEIIKTRDAEEDDGLEVNEEAFSSQQTSEPRLHNYRRSLQMTELKGKSTASFLCKVSSLLHFCPRV